MIRLPGGGTDSYSELIARLDNPDAALCCKCGETKPWDDQGRMRFQVVPLTVPPSFGSVLVACHYCAQQVRADRDASRSDS